MTDRSDSEGKENEQEIDLDATLNELSKSLGKVTDESSSPEEESIAECTQDEPTDRAAENGDSESDQPEHVSRAIEDDGGDEVEQTSPPTGRKQEATTRSHTGSDTAGAIDMWEAQNTVRDSAAALIDRPLDGIIAVLNDDENGWRVVVEVIERRSVPDTQDILGRYDIRVNEKGDIHAYRQTGRYRRGDTRQ